MRIRAASSLLLITSGFLITSCSSSTPADNRIADAVALRALDEQWSATAAKKDLAGTLAFYAEDAVLLPPNAAIATDRKSIADSWAGLIGESTDLSWKVSKIEVAKSGELGYLYGTYTESPKDPKRDPSLSDTGKMVEIWKKQADGTWKCIVDTYNSDLPAAAVKK